MSMHDKYEVSISYGSKVMAKVKVFATDRPTGQKTRCPQIPFEGHKYLFYCNVILSNIVEL